ncbi:Yme2 protein [Hanseniaspora uvarum]|nr:Yme2 protein [Hanseniaspora uvarum]
MNLIRKNTQFLKQHAKFHTFQYKPLVVNSKRFISTDIKKADEESGETNETVIEKTKRETLFYFDNVFTRTNVLTWYTFFALQNSNKEARQKIMDLTKNNFEMTDFISMRRDGGAFAKFLVPYPYTVADINLKIQKLVQDSQKGFVFKRVTCFPTKGTPLVEDMQRLPSRNLILSHEGKLPEQDVYSLFRRYGQIVEISCGDKTTLVQFKNLYSAVCAKNCVNGFTLNNINLIIKFDKNTSHHLVRNFYVNHTRLAIPLSLALLSILALLIFDPIREYMIELKITKKFQLLNKSYYSNLLKYFNKETADEGTAFFEDEVNDFKMWLEENNNTFVVIRGPRGSGKNSMVRAALKDRDNVMYLDCDSLVKTRIDSRFLANASSQLGYYPIFPWINSFVSIIDLGVQSLTGQKSGLSESKEKQFNSMLATAVIAIRRVALSKYVSGNEEDYLLQHPDAKPVIVIDRFSSTSEINSFVYKELAEWAALLVQMNLAHVVFLTETISNVSLLTQSLPNQIFKNMVLSDASEEVARKYVLKNFNKELDLNTIQPLGGRMLDLQAFIRRIKSGESEYEALSKMKSQAIEQITQMFLSDTTVRGAQAFELVEKLALNGQITMKDIRYSNIFKSNPEAALLDLEKDGLISISRDRGMLATIKPAKPLFREAFMELMNDEPVFKLLKTAYYIKIVGFEAGRIQKWEDEIKNFKYVQENGKSFKPRLDYLANKIKISSEIIDNAEGEIKKFATSK